MYNPTTPVANCRESALAIIAGIDEAGLGPVLGPLVVSASAFFVPDEVMGMSMWRLLSPTVSKKVSKRRLAIAIGDSKRLYSSRKDKALQHLERGVLGFLPGKGPRPDTLGALLAAVAPDAVPLVSRYSWYAPDELSLPTCLTATDVALGRNALSVAMARAGVKVALLRSQVVCVGEFNRLLSATRNKSTTLFDITSQLLVRLWKLAGSGPVRIYVDRHGSRIRYLPALQRVFGTCQFKILDENENLSAYRLSDADRTAELIFTKGAEDKHLPVALASMLSKYLRELFMILLNRFWASTVPGIKPTAGYYVDGRRFFGEISPAARNLGIDKSLLYRSR